MPSEMNARTITSPETTNAINLRRGRNAYTWLNMRYRNEISVKIRVTGLVFCDLSISGKSNSTGVGLDRCQAICQACERLALQCGWSEE